MDTQNEDSTVKSTYPPEYAHIEKKVQDAIEKIRQFDERITNMPNDKGPELNYSPPSFIKSRQFGSRNQSIDFLEKAKVQLKTETWKEIEDELKDKNSTMETQVRDRAREEIYPNIYDKMDETEKKDHGGKSKDIELSQDFMSSALKDAKAKWIEKNESNLAKKPDNGKQSKDIEESQITMNAMLASYREENNLNKEAISAQDFPKEQNYNGSLSVRFSKSLNYTKTLEKSDKNIAPSKDKDSPDKG